MLSSPAQASAVVPPDVWLIDEKVAVQFFDCNALLCGRIVWLPRDKQGQLKLDKNNPDLALQQRQLCGPTIIWNLHTADEIHWTGGWFYNPDDGDTYSVRLEHQDADTLLARIYVENTLFGRTKILHRQTHGTTSGWC